jgi:uncharacterized protein
MTNPHSSSAVIQKLFSALAAGDIAGVLDSFHPDAAVTAVREADRAPGEVYGSYHGREGMQELLTNLANTFETRAFAVNHIVGDGRVGFAQGSFTQVVKANGKCFSAPWALMCLVDEGRIREYHFFEDSEAFASRRDA